MSKAKELKFEIIDRKETDELYVIMQEIIDARHVHLAEAKIVLAWKLDWQPDCDGRLTLGMCKKASDLDRLLHDYDFVILLNRDFWDNFSDKQQRAIIEHELLHCAINADDKGKPKRDDTGRIVYRTRGHDLEEFRAIVEIYGTWKSDIEAFAQSLAKAREMPLFEQESIAGQIGAAAV